MASKQGLGKAAAVFQADPASSEESALLQAHQARLAAIVECSDDAIISKNASGIVASWNAAAERVFGWTAAEMIGVSILKIIPPARRAEEDHILAMIRRGERVDHFETTRLTKDGRLISVSITVSPIRDARGRIIGASKIVRDTTQLLEADRTRAILAAIVQSSDDAIVSKDLDGRVTSWNSAAERMYGWSAAEIVGQPIFVIIPDELRAEEEGILARVRDGERVEHFETERMHRSGRRLEVSITVSPVRDSSGRIIGASKIARDIGPQREAARERDRFLAILAHELRNPLAPIRNAIALIGQPNASDASRERACSIAERQIAHMAHLLNDLLDVARISTGRVDLQCADIDLRRVIEHAVDSARAQIAARGHELRVHHPAEALRIHADEARVLQIVANLLANAAKYTDKGGTIVLDYRREGDAAMIEVRDNGIGFTGATRQRLFTLFSQAADVHGRADGGLGIGLALVREFAERHGGRVDATSEGLGRGSTFRVWLPLMKPA